MALFKPRERLDIDPFTDLLFNALLTFTFLFLIALLLMNPTAKTGIINPKAEFMITVSWPDHSPDDIDTWVEGPKGQLIWFKRPQEGLMHLDRDDRGRVNDMQLIDGKEIVNPLNQEIVSIRGRPAGEFIVNIHYYRSQTLQAIPVTVYLAEVNPTLKVLHYATTTLQREGEERTAVRFSITPQGQVTAINTLQKSLVLGGKI
ncbi:hypothetical protein SAMN02745130_00684 [Thiothrix eikelboomii]|uniref:Uncharacterized protein n=1 Tax=Thiothrix eikelboomii TaxID=92487 RepID=A0A1T4W0F3_9GAMM|nr:hypothetical protein [Thiothrix eikelboomii]SKA70201.1 hypothetical protein SAMN02745130_00684 [Thiothrix eikelboomii]